MSINRKVFSAFLIGGLLSVSAPALANSGQTGLNGSESTNQTGNTINNKGGVVNVDTTNVNKTKQINDNSIKRVNSDDINQKQNSTQLSNTESGANSGSSSGISTSEDNDTHQTTYFQPSSQATQSNQFNHAINLPNGEQIQFGCPNKTSNFNVGTPWAGIGYGKSSDKIPEDCLPLIERSQMRFSMYDAQRAACGLGPGYMKDLNRTMYATSMAAIKGSTYKDELRLMRKSGVGEAKVSMLDTFNKICGTNFVEQTTTSYQPTSPYTPISPTPTKVRN